MKQISSLFDVYKKRLRPPQATVEQEVVVVVTNLTGITLKSEQVSYIPTTRVVSLRVPSVLRTEVMQHKTAILEALKRSLGEKHCPTELR